MFNRLLSFLIVFGVLIAAVISAFHHFLDDRHTGVVIAPDDQRLSALVERIEALEGQGADADQIGSNTDGIAALNDLYGENATNIEELAEQIGALAGTVSELQATLPGDAGDNSILDRIAARVKTLERDQKITWSRAQHAHCLSHKALGQPCE